MEVKAGYKQTEVGVIPEDWQLTDFETLGNVIDGDRGTQYPGRFDFGDSGHCLFLNAGNVTKEGFRFAECAFITREKDTALNKGKLKRNDIVLTTRGTIGNWAFFDAAVPFENMRINSGMVILRNDSASLDTGFLYALLQSRLVQLQIKRLTFGSAQPQLTVRDINKFEVVVPSLREQRAIATALSDADALIESLTQLLAKKRLLKQGAMQELLTGKKRLPGFSGVWVVKKIGDVLTIAHGKSQHHVSDRNGIYPILATGGQIGTANRFLYDKPSVLIGRKGTIDQPQYMDTPFWTVDTLFYSVIHEPNDAKFLFYRFCLIDWKQHNEASGVPSLNARTIERIEIMVPQQADQTAIATILSDMDTDIAALETKLTKARNIKQGMMQELLTGRIRLV